MASLILDGYDLDGDVQKRGRFPAIKYVYRPALPDEVQEYFMALRKANDGRQSSKVRIDLIAAHVKSWDVQDAGGKNVPADAANLGRVPNYVIDAMVDEITLYAQSEAAADAKNSPGG